MGEQVQPGVEGGVELVAGAVSLRAVASTPAPAAVAGSGLDLDAVLTVRYEALLDGSALTAQELEQLAEAKRPLVRLRGQWVVADPTVIECAKRYGDPVELLERFPV